jgi:hypothetical protein
MSRVLRLGSYDNLLVAVLFLAVLLTCGLSPMQTDTWWQLRAGQDMWASGTVLLTDTYSHTASGAFWPNHEWLAEVFFYGLYKFGGLGLLTLFSAGLIAAGWAFTWRLTQGPTRRVFIWVALALVPSAGWWEPRPHAFSLLFIPLTVFLLVRGRAWWLPPIFLVWANVHGGVILGLVLLGVGLGAQVVIARSLWRRSLLVLAACVLAVTATPLGLSFWTEIPASLSRISQYTFDEWKRPGLTELSMVPFWIIGLLYCLAILRNVPRLRRMTPAEATVHACALALLPGAVGAVRNVGPFLMLAVPALTSLLYARNERQGSDAGTETQRPLVNLALMCLGALAVALTVTTAYRNSWPRLRWTPLPEGALAALKECSGNLYNRYDEGGYLLWFAPQRKVFLDGRQDPFPIQLVLEHIEMETGQRDHQDVFTRHNIRCAFLPIASPTAARLSTAGWQTLYRDRRWVVLGD